MCDGDDADADASAAAARSPVNALFLRTSPGLWASYHFAAPSRGAHAGFTLTLKMPQSGDRSFFTLHNASHTAHCLGLGIHGFHLCDTVGDVARHAGTLSLGVWFAKNSTD
jgi:hypothetical protein